MIRNETGEQGMHDEIKQEIGNSPIEGLGANSTEFVALFPPGAPGSVL